MNNQNNFNEQRLINKIISSSNGKINRNMLEGAMQGNSDALLGALSAEDRKRLEGLLADKTAAQALLNSEAAQRLIRSLQGK